jgi:hypothetical protein
MAVQHKRVMVNMARFWELLKESVITQSLITLLLVVTVCVIYLTDRPVPSELSQLLWIVVAFWMGTKAQHVIESSTKKGS